MSDFVIVTGYDEKYRRMGAGCKRSLARYSEVFGIAARVVNEFTSGRPAAWEKIRIIVDLFAEGWEYVCWIDADAAFVRFDVDIRDELRPDRDLLWVCSELVERRPGPVVFTVLQPCSGFMVIRNSAWARQFLEDAWKRTEFLNHPWWELAAFIHLCGYHRAYDSKMQDSGKRELLAMVDPAREFRTPEDILSHVGRLDVKWNTTDQSARTASANPVVRHFTGSCGPLSIRLALMEGREGQAL